MYFEQAISRINNVDWKVFRHTEKKDFNLGREYMIRVAKFLKEYSFIPYPPLSVNVAELLGNDKRIALSDYCSDECVQILFERKFETTNVRFILECYLELSKFSDAHHKYKKYLEIYEPLIRLVEVGINFRVCDNGLEIENCCWYPRAMWLEIFRSIDEAD